ncbi:MAG: phosphatase PAP2 family protein [Candidatus Nanoarchaeia archaeon]
MQNDLFRDITALGGLPVYALVTCLMLFENWDFGLMLVYAVVICYLLTIIIRTCYYKERPKPRNHTNFIEKLDASSFPSLHSMRATVLALFLGVLFVHPVQRLFLAICWIAACISRVELDKHDFKDVIGGVFLGILIVLGLW